MPRKKETPTPAEQQSSGAPSSSGAESKSVILVDLEHMLNRLKILMFLGKNDPETAQLLLNRDKVREAAEIISLDKDDDKKREKILKALGSYETAEKAENLTMAEALGIEAPEKEEFDKSWTIEGKSVEVKLAELVKNGSASDQEIAEIREKIEKVKARYGSPEVRLVELESQTLSEIEDGVNSLIAKRNYQITQGLRENSGGKTLVGATFAREIEDEKGLLQVRDGGKEQTKLEKIVEKVRKNASRDFLQAELEKRSPEELLSRFEDVNTLLVKMSKLTGTKIDYQEAKRLRWILTNLQTQYQEGLASKMAEAWQKENKPESWTEVRYSAMEKVIRKKQKWFSQEVKFKGNGQVKKIEKLDMEFREEARKLAEKLKREDPKMVRVEETRLSGELNDEAWRQEALTKQVESELDTILGTAKDKYNPFEDKDFWSDLKRGDEGIKDIIQRAKSNGIKKPAELELIIRRLAELKTLSAEGRLRRPGAGATESQFASEGGPAVLGELMLFMEMGEYAAAANAMLEYTTRVGMQENTNDLQYMYVRRMYLEAISKISNDFTDQFGKNQQIGYLPGLTTQKPEEFFQTQAKVFSKNNLDLLLGTYANMSGNVIEVDGKEFLFSTKSVMAALRSERNILRIMNADPNSMDSTIRAIMLEEMFGEGAKVRVADVDGKDVLYLSVPGQAGERALSDIKVGVKFAELDKRGFKGWRAQVGIPEGKDVDPKTGKERIVTRQFTLEDMLDRNQWIMRNGLSFMWYSETWMDVLKSYQPAVMKNAPKALLTAASAIADYKASFELVAPPFLDLVQKIGDMLGPMERYKSEDMVAKNISKMITKHFMERESGWSDDEVTRRADQGINKKIGDLFEKIYVRKTEATLNGEHVTLNNRLRSREMMKHAFNDYEEMSETVAGIVRKRLVDLGLYEKDIPSEAELITFYQRWKDEAAEGRLLGGKEGYMGQEYAAVWEELFELKMSAEDRALWASIDNERFGVLKKMNDEVTGGFGEPLTKDNFWQRFEMEAFVDRTGTKHGDDWEQFGMKYAPAKLEALKLVVKIGSLKGNAEDYIKLMEHLDLFATPDVKKTIVLSLMDRQSISTREQWLAPYEVAETEGEKSSFSIKWVDFTDSTGNKFFARTADGTRAYHKKMFRGNYARQVLDKDWWRPHDFENLLLKWRTDGFLTKTEAHHMAEKLLGTKRTVDYLVDGAAKNMGIDTSRLEGFKKFITKGTTSVKLLALKAFFFDDPKYALWTLFEEFRGFGGKTMEHIFGFSVGGGGGRH